MAVLPSANEVEASATWVSSLIERTAGSVRSSATASAGRSAATPSTMGNVPRTEPPAACTAAATAVVPDQPMTTTRRRSPEATLPASARELMAVCPAAEEVSSVGDASRVAAPMATNNLVALVIDLSFCGQWAVRKRPAVLEVRGWRIVQAHGRHRTVPRSPDRDTPSGN